MGDSSYAHAMPRDAITDLYSIEDMLSADERAVRDTVSRFVDKEYLPIVGRHFRNGTFPLEVVLTNRLPSSRHRRGLP